MSFALGAGVVGRAGGLGRAGWGGGREISASGPNSYRCKCSSGGVPGRDVLHLSNCHDRGRLPSESCVVCPLPPHPLVRLGWLSPCLTSAHPHRHVVT